jgi:hypothetical protein
MSSSHQCGSHPSHPDGIWPCSNDAACRDSGYQVTNWGTKVRALRGLDTLILQMSELHNYTHFSTKMSPVYTPPMSPRLPGMEIKTKHKEAMRQLRKRGKLHFGALQRYYDLGESTVRKVLNYESPERARIGRSGRPRESLGKQEVEDIITYISTDHAIRELSWQQIVNELKLSCSAKTLKRRLNEAGYHSCIECQKPFLSRTQAHLRWI